MKLTDFIFQSFELVQGMEKRLRQRKQNATVSLFITIAGIAQLILSAAIGDKKINPDAVIEFSKKIWQLNFAYLLKDGVPIPELAGAILIFGGVTGYATLRWTNLLMNEAEEPFRYTFHIDEFKPIKGTPANRFELINADRLILLSHDLTERLNQRITRLSILNPSADSMKDIKNLNLSSHIHIEGEYVVRQKNDEQWVFQVMARIRIGSPDRSMTLSHPVKYDLPEISENEGKYALSADEYNQIVELLYSRVVTEIYRQIEDDIRDKMHLFPTYYQRAVALSREAKDFSRSNTIDAFDRSISLYRQALRYFAAADIKPLTSWLTKIPILWRHEARYLHRKATVVTGYSECLVYRRKLSALSGRYRNPVFEVPKLLDEAIDDLEVLQRQITGTRNAGRTGNNRDFLTFPKDIWWRKLLWRPSEEAFESHRKIYFDALVVSALAYNELGAIETAENRLKDARAVDPDRGERDPLYLLAAGEIEQDLDTSAQRLQMAADIAPSFQFAKFRLAHCNEMRFRRKGEFSAEKAQTVIKAYDDIFLNINSGNIAALSAQGYLYWFLAKCPMRCTSNMDDNFFVGCGWWERKCPQYEMDCPRFDMGRKAEKKFKQGLALKSIVQETFVGELNYGLARITAEMGRYNDCYDYFTQAISSDPGVAAHAANVNVSKPGMYSYYEYITPVMMDRYQCYHDEVLRCLQVLRNKANRDCRDKDDKKCTEHTLDVVMGFVLNDYGNACFNYHRRMGEPSYLDKAIGAYRDAIKTDCSNAVAHYNLGQALLWKSVSPDQVEKHLNDIANYLKWAEVLAPTWPVIHTEVVKAELMLVKQPIASLKSDKENKENEIERLKKEQTYWSDKENKENKIERLKEDGGKRPEQTWRESAKSRIHELDREVCELDKKLKDAEEELQADIAKRVINRLRTTITETQFGPMMAVKLDYDGAGVSEVAHVAATTQWANENDIYALHLWAEVLSSNTNSQQALMAAKHLWSALEGYYPENFNRDYIILETLMQTLKGHEIKKTRDCVRDVLNFRKRCRKAIDYAIKQDPQHFRTLEWQSDKLIGIKQKKRIQTLEKIQFESPGRSILLANEYRNKNEWKKAIESLRKAVRLTSGEACYWNELGNAYFSIGSYKRSLRGYRRAIEFDNEVAVYHSNLGGAWKQLEKWDKACAAYDQASKLAQGTNKKRYLDDLKLTFNEWGNRYFEQCNFSEARNKYQQALDLDEGDAVIHSNLALAWEQEVPDPVVIEKAIEALACAVKLAPDDSDYKQRLMRLRTLRDSFQFFTLDAIQRLPVVTPIVLEVATNLIPLVSLGDTLSPEFQANINDMRNKIRKAYGVNIPAIRVRGNEADLPDGTYIIMLMEVPIVSGNVNLERLLVLTAPDKLKASGVAAENTSDPMSGKMVSWIDHRDIKKVKDLGFEVFDTNGYMCRHLQAVVCRNLPDFNGVQETLNIINMECPDMLQHIRDSCFGLVGLTTVLKALLSEEVPITPLPEIVAKFLILSKEKSRLKDVAEALRRIPELKENLPGNQAGLPLFRLDLQFEVTVLQSLRSVDDEPVLSMEPATAQQALTAIRKEIADLPTAAIVVKNPVIRPYLRTLVELEFPRLFVLAEDELIRQLADYDVKEISL